MELNQRKTEKADGSSKGWECGPCDKAPGQLKGKCTRHEFRKGTFANKGGWKKWEDFNCDLVQKGEKAYLGPPPITTNNK